MKKNILLFIFSFAAIMIAFANEADSRTLRVMSQGAIGLEIPLTQIDSIVFCDSTTEMSVAFALTVHPTNGAEAIQIELDDIQRITFDENAKEVKTLEGITTLFAFEDFLKITFEEMEKDDPNFIFPVVADADLKVYISSGELVAMSSAQINSMTLLSIDGRVIQQTGGARMFIGSLPASVYLLQVHTEQGSFTTRIIKQ